MDYCGIQNNYFSEGELLLQETASCLHQVNQNLQNIVKSSLKNFRERYDNRDSQKWLFAVNWSEG